MEFGDPYFVMVFGTLHSTGDASNTQLFYVMETSGIFT